MGCRERKQRGAAANASQLSLRQPAVAFLEPIASLSMVCSFHSSTESKRLSVRATDNEVFLKAIITSTKPFILHVSVTLQKYSFSNYLRDRELISVPACCGVMDGPRGALRVKVNGLVLLRGSPC